MAHRGILKRIRLRSTEPKPPRKPAERVWRVLQHADTLDKAIIGSSDSLAGAFSLARWLVDGGALLPLLIVEGTAKTVFGKVVGRIDRKGE